MSILTKNKFTEIFFAVDEFCKEYSQTIKENKSISCNDSKKLRARQHEMSDS